MPQNKCDNTECTYKAHHKGLCFSIRFPDCKDKFTNTTEKEAEDQAKKLRATMMEDYVK